MDSTLLIYAHRQDSEFHDRAKEVSDLLRHQAAPWAIPWPCIHEVISVTTHPSIFKRPSTIAEAFGFVDSLIASPHLHLLAESTGYLEKLREISTAARLKGPRIHDARIAALLPAPWSHRIVVSGP